MSKYPTNVAITYTASASTVGTPGATFSYAWAFDDGGTGGTASVGHTWTTDGSHVATVIATDTTTNGTATATKTIETSSATWVGNAAYNRAWEVITYGNGLFVSAADGNTTGTDGIITSTDGSTWTQRTSPVAMNFTGAAYGNGTYVFVGTNATVNYVIYSTDSITWSVPTFPNKQWQCVAYGNGVFAALSYIGGTTGQAMTSPDGITWTSRNTAADRDWRGICYGGGQFVAVCSGDVTMTSPDGITWTSHSAAANKVWVGVAYGNGIYVAIADTVTTGQVMWSSDGITWNLVSLPNAVVAGAVTFGNGQFIITTVTTGLAYGSYMTTDAQTFYQISTNVTNGVWSCCTYGTDRFVAMNRATNANKAQVLLW